MFISTLPQSKQRKCRIFSESVCRWVFWFYFSITVTGHASYVVILTKPRLTRSVLKRVVVGRGITFSMFAVQILQKQSAKGNVIKAWLWQGPCKFLRAVTRIAQKEEHIMIQQKDVTVQRESEGDVVTSVSVLCVTIVIVFCCNQCNCSVL